MGSVSQGVVQHATRPVLIARPSGGPFDQILLGYDSSPQAKRALRFIERLNLQRKAQLRLVRVIEPFTVPSGTPVAYRKRAIEETHQINERRRRTATRALNLVANRLRQVGWRVETEVLAGSAAHELDEAARRGADLIVVGSRRPSPARHYLLGSTAEKLVRHAPMSVLVVR